MNNRPYRDIIRSCAMWPGNYSCIRLSGADHSDLLHRLTTNEIRQLQVGEGRITVFCSEVGRIIARAMLLKFEDSILLVTENSAGSALADWIEKYIFIEDVKVEELSTTVGSMTIVGPDSVELTAKYFTWDLSGLEAWQHRTLVFKDKAIHVFACDYLELPALVFVSENGVIDEIARVWRSFDCPELNNQEYEIIRIASGWPAAEIDYDTELNPHEAGMLAYIDFDKGCYIGQEVIARLDTYEKVKKKLVRVVLQSESPVNARATIILNNEEIGYITSSVSVPKKNQVLALGYVERKAVSDKLQITVQDQQTSIKGYLEQLD